MLAITDVLCVKANRKPNVEDLTSVQLLDELERRTRPS
jgi:hypothetical protein